MRLRSGFACLAALTAAAAFPQSREAAVQKALDAYVAEHHLVGASAAVLERDGTHFETGSGFQDREAKTRASARTVYRLGSISKPVTAVAAMQLVESGKLSLFAPVAALVPEWPHKEAGITLRHLLTHTSGIRHYAAGKSDVFFEPFTVKSSLDVFKDDPLLFQPGAKVSYSTHAFSLVARLVEIAGGGNFAEIVRRRVAAPAGAQSLRLEDRSKPDPARSALYELSALNVALRQTREENISWKSGGGGMEASAPDLARFAMAVLENRLLRPQTTDFMFQRQIIDGLDTGRGLGWALDAKGNPVHGGAQQGCRSYLAIDRKAGRVVAVMTNTGGNHPIHELAQAVASAWSATTTRR
ncbi:MAG: beta-lactamase family protein [Fimbriimonadaceae bacterium]|nr:beta-lactamase family protein [Chthonomonadaceae bacterium]MCO5297129.1 beta-lactamase family protein [Fimbriimonadaceae bacterium]